MVSKQLTRLFFGVLLVSAATSALSPGLARAEDYDVLMAPPTEEVQVAQATGASSRSEFPPANIPTGAPYSEDKVDTQAVAPASSPESDPKKSPVDYAADAVDY